MLIVCFFNGAIFCYVLNGISDNVILRLEELSRNMTWLNWLCLDFVIAGVCVQTLLRTKLTLLFLLI